LEEVGKEEELSSGWMQGVVGERSGKSDKQNLATHGVGIT
jgi:hypothetical protein